MWLRIWRIGRICAYGVYDVYGVCVHTPGGALVLAPLIWRICAYGVYCVYGVYVCIWRILRLWRMCADGVYGVYGVYGHIRQCVPSKVCLPMRSRCSLVWSLSRMCSRESWPGSFVCSLGRCFRVEGVIV